MQVWPSISIPASQIASAGSIPFVHQRSVLIVTVGAVGATRPGGVASSDTFNKREKAAEDLVQPFPPSTYHYPFESRQLTSST